MQQCHFVGMYMHDMQMALSCALQLSKHVYESQAKSAVCSVDRRARQLHKQTHIAAYTIAVVAAAS